MNSIADFDDATVDQLAKRTIATTRVQHLANRITSALGKPMSLVVIFGIAIAWIIGNYVARATGSTALEEFPFPDRLHRDYWGTAGGAADPDHPASR